MMLRLGTVVLVLLSTLVGKVGALDRCTDQFMGCSTPCSNSYSFTVSGETFYKTTQVMAGCSCNGNEFPVFQKCTSAGCYNKYMYYSCTEGKWGSSVITNTDTATGGGFPNVHGFPATSTSQCPDSGSATCAGPAPAVSSSPPPPAAITGASDTSGTSDAATPTAGACSDGDAICAPMAPYLPSSCKCSGTNGGTGSFTECQEDFFGLGSFGVKIELEPCDCGGAYAEVSYQVGGDWTTAGRLAAGETNKFPIPGLTIYGGAGLYVEVAVSGGTSNLVVDVHLSLCHNGKCDGDIEGGPIGYGYGVPGYGQAASALGFPFALITDLKGVDFTEQCKCAPECTSDSSTGMAVGIAIAAVVAVLLIAGTAAGVVIYKKKHRWGAASVGSEMQVQVPQGVGPGSRLPGQQGRPQQARARASEAVSFSALRRLWPPGETAQCIMV